MRVAIWESFGLSTSRAVQMVRAVGAIEASFGVVMVIGSRRRWPFLIALATMPGVVFGVAKGNRSMLTDAFNPIAEAVAVWALAGAALLTLDD